MQFNPRNIATGLFFGGVIGCPVGALVASAACTILIPATTHPLVRQVDEAEIVPQAFYCGLIASSFAGALLAAFYNPRISRYWLSLVLFLGGSMFIPISPPRNGVNFKHRTHWQYEEYLLVPFPSNLFLAQTLVTTACASMAIVVWELLSRDGLDLAEHAPSGQSLLLTIIVLAMLFSILHWMHADLAVYVAFVAMFAGRWLSSCVIVNWKTGESP